MSKKPLPIDEALEFYEPIIQEIKEKYGTTNIEELKKMLEESNDLWLEEHIHDVEMYNALKDMKLKQVIREWRKVLKYVTGDNL